MFAAPALAAALALQQRAEVFLRRAANVVAHEPTLYPNPQFAAYQAWTLKYQKYGVRPETAGRLRRLFQTVPDRLRLEDVESAYDFYGLDASSMLDGLFRNIAIHVDMTPEPMRSENSAKITRALQSVLPGSGGELSDFQPTDCDYVAQPINALWFTLNASRLVDDYGRILFGVRWIARREELKRIRGGRIKEFDEFRVLERGLPPPVATP